MATTPGLALPYPVGTDLIMDGDNAIRALAERVEARLPWGVLPNGYAQVVADQAGITTAGADVTGLTITVSVAAARRIRLSSRTRSTFTVLTGSATATVQLYEGATLLAEWSMSHSGAGSIYTHGAEVILTPSAGAHTYKMRAVVNGGTMTVQGSATNPAFIMAEDIGPAVPTRRLRDDDRPDVDNALPDESEPEPEHHD